jgi:hypothetical protein
MFIERINTGENFTGIEWFQLNSSGKVISYVSRF